MKKRTIEKFFEFLRKKEGKQSLLSDIQTGVDLSPWEGTEYMEEIDLSYSQVQNLPENLIIHGDLLLGGTPIQYLPKGLKVFGILNLSKSKIKELPEDLWAETVALYEVQHQVKIPKEPKFFNLITSHTAGMQLLEGFILRGAFVCDYFDSPSLPENMSVGRLSARKSRLEKLPNNLTSSHSVDISHSLIKEIPRNLKIGGDFQIDDTPLVDIFLGGINIRKSVFELSPEEVRKVQLGIKQEVKNKGGYIKGRVII